MLLSFVMDHEKSYLKLRIPKKTLQKRVRPPEVREIYQAMVRIKFAYPDGRENVKSSLDALVHLRAPSMTLFTFLKVCSSRSETIT
jgi:hypothetical protein